MTNTDAFSFVNDLRKTHGRSRVVKASWRGDTVFLKQAGEAKTWQWWHHLHAGSSRFLPVMLRHGGIIDEKTALMLERQRLEIWADKSLPAPRLLASGEDWILLSDGGKGFLDVLRDADIETRQHLLPQALAMLLFVHAQGESHGRPMVKDMAMRADGTMVMLDHELDAVPIMPLAAAQARDLFIFLVSTVKYATPQTLSALADQALTGSAPTVIDEMKKALQLLAPVVRILSCLPQKKLGREIGGAVVLYGILREKIALRDSVFIC